MDDQIFWIEWISCPYKISMRNDRTNVWSTRQPFLFIEDSCLFEVYYWIRKACLPSPIKKILFNIDIEYIKMNNDTNIIIEFDQYFCVTITFESVRYHLRNNKYQRNFQGNDTVEYFIYVYEHASINNRITEICFWIFELCHALIFYLQIFLMMQSRCFPIFDFNHHRLKNETKLPMKG